MSASFVEGGLKEQFAYFRSFGRLVICHEFDINFLESGGMKFTVHFVNDGDRNLEIGFTNALYKRSFRFFVDGVAVPPVGVFPTQYWHDYISISSLGIVTLEIEAIFINGHVIFPNSTSFNVEKCDFEVNFTFSGVTSNHIVVKID